MKRLRRLVSQRKARSQERAFVLEGFAIVAEALEAHASGAIELEAIFVGPDIDGLRGADEIIGRAGDLAIEVHHVIDGVLDSILDTVTPQPVAGIGSRSEPTVADLGTGGVVLCLIDARDPGNVGTLIRSAEAAGAAGLVLAGSSVDPTNPKVVRASAGSLLRLPVVAVDSVETALDELALSGRSLVATVIGAGAIPYDDVRLVDAAIVLGNEAHGLDPSVVARCDVSATIPLAGPTESLNLGIAGSLFCFEALRQQRSPADRSNFRNSLDK